MTAVIERRRIYGRRQSHRIRPARRRLLEDRLPELQVTVPSDGATIDLSEVFSPACQRCWLEIGFGGGEHLAAQAAACPEVGLIGCEPYVNGVARLLSLIGDADNVRVVIDDARLLLKALPAASFERIFVLFPDPWPKARHHKRRIVNPETLADMARLLQPGGELRLATDIMSYARPMLAGALANGRFDWLADRPADWRLRPADWPATRYEEKARKAGRTPVFFRFRRR
ncbi:MAG: tRNA (guanine(46)-N(7))-methyltransferase TrmB [Alphaproteobacteria bacterium]|nr:tRNA (guanine(46)-N(7))-methyltransferase TrmB [Alphaproteobacteria bacterium]